MADSFSKLRCLAALAVALAGTSYGQTASCSADDAAGGAFPGAVNPGTKLLRAEGTTELVGDFQFNCTTDAVVNGNGTLVSFLSAPVTSRLNSNNIATPFTEATLFICASAALCNTAGAPVPAAGTVSATYGVVSGSTITFDGLTFPGGNFFGRISNVRVNANTVPLGSALTALTEQILIRANNTSAATNPASTVGYVLTSLATPTLIGPGAQSYNACAGNPLPTNGNLLPISFAISVGETFGGAFKLPEATPGQPNAAVEAGSYISSDGSGAGSPSSGTQIQLVFGGVPDGVTLYLPTAITNGTLTLTLAAGVSTATGTPPSYFPPGGGVPALPATFPAGETVAASAGLTAAGGGVTAVYAVTGTDATVVNESAVIPVWVVFAPGVVTAAQGAITVTEGYSPQLTPSPVEPVPSFAPVTTGTLAASGISLCQTNLLFPYVSNQLGFDTGLALANTSIDPFGTPTETGSCNLNFYGTGPPYPNTGVPAPGGNQIGGSVSTFLLSNVAPGFAGYIIAVCSYNFGHGFAYITDNLAQDNGLSIGYLAPILPNRSTGALSESLSH
jgi:hypothetical protein